MKSIICISLIAIVLVHNTFAASQEWGFRINGDSLVASKRIYKAAIKYSIVTDTLDYKTRDNQMIVTYIRVVDNNPEAGGSVTLLSGPGSRSADLYFRSAFSKGLDMSAEIYAKRRF